MLGYAMLDRFGEEIGRYMTTTVQGCTWECINVKESGWSGSQQMYKVKIGVENSFEHEDVLNHCCLAPISDSMGSG